MTVKSKTCGSCGRSFANETDFTEDITQWRKCEAGNLWFNCNCGSTLMIPKGKFDWYSPEPKLSNAANSMFNQLTNIDQLPYIPTLIMQFQVKLQDDNTTTPDLAAIAKQEPILASEIIALANRLKDTRNPDNNDIRSIEHAITYVGRDELKDYTLAISIKNFSLKTKAFDSKRFWEHAFIRGAIAENLVKDLGLEIEKDPAYLGATLCNVGKIVGAILFPEKIDAIHEAVNNPETLTTWKTAEAKYPKANHTILGEIGTAIWGLPDYILNAARYHHRGEIKPNSLKDGDCIAELAGLANLITHWIKLEPTRIDENHFNELIAGFGLSNDEIEKLIERYRGLRFLKVNMAA